jgi:hypothetical protein
MVDTINTLYDASVQPGRTLTLYPQVEVQFAIDAAHPFVVPFEAFDIAQIHKAQANVPNVCGCRSA